MPGRILVIEDNADNLELLHYLLDAFGYPVLAATDGLAGLQLARDARPDLVLCDIQLPGIDGLEIARRLRADPATHEMRLYAVTAFARDSDRERVLASGFDGYFSKPIDPQEFIAHIQRILPRS